MKDRLVSLFGGFILSLVIIIFAMWFLSRPEKATLPVINPIDPAKFQVIREATTSLSNPSVQSAPPADVGRTNPFDNY